MDKKLISEQLHALAKSNSHRSKTSLLRDIFDDIEMALAAGVRRTAILDVLAQQNIHMSIATFDVTVRRIRKERNQQKVDINHTIIKNNDLKSTSKEEQITLENEQIQNAQQTKNPLVINSPQTETKKPTTSFLPDIAKKLPDDFVNPLEEVMEKYKKEREENHRKDTLGWNSVPDLEKIYGKKK